MGLKKEKKFRQPIFNRDGTFNEWHYWGFFLNEKGEWVIVGHATAVPGITDPTQSQQYLGLRDVNDKEIYEGDYAKCWLNFGPAGDYLRLVEVGFSPFGGVIQEWLYKENKLPEVVGNVIETPNLLK